ncbi:MAG: phosphoribosylglycinamide formyltransferase, partial [Clostridia bacterium]|nr:phosphoribosylglycinamide formyltransferase [Clostridia bacterium]
MKKIAVLVSGGGTNLQALIDAEKAGELGCGKISLVIASKPGVYALERAANNGIKSMVLARKDYEDIAAYSKALADALEAEGTDLVVLAGFLTIID